MELREEVFGEVTVLEVRGRLDNSTAPALEERLQRLCVPGGRLVVDLHQLEYISSAGFRVFLLAAKRTDANAAQLVLCGLSARVTQLFDLGGFRDFFRIAGSRDDAIGTVK